MTIIGYSDDKQSEPYWLVRNSFGTNWGDQGSIKLKMYSNTCGLEANTVVGITD